MGRREISYLPGNWNKTNKSLNSTSLEQSEKHTQRFSSTQRVHARKVNSKLGEWIRVWIKKQHFLIQMKNASSKKINPLQINYTIYILPYSAALYNMWGDWSISLKTAPPTSTYNFLPSYYPYKECWPPSDPLPRKIKLKIKKKRKQVH